MTWNFLSRKRFRRLILVGAAVVLAGLLLGAVAILAGRYWVIPHMLRQQITVATGEQWDGPLTIETVRFNWTAPTELQDITLSDSDGREWLHVETVRLTLRDWPGLQPALSEVDVEGLALKAHIVDGQLRLPLKPLPPRDRESPYIDIQSLAVRRLSAGVVNNGREITTWDDLQLTVLRDEQRYNFEMDRPTTAPGETLHIAGTVERETLELDIQVVVQHTLTPDRVGLALEALKVPLVDQADGKIAIDMNVRGRTTDLLSPSDLEISGVATLTDGNVFLPKGRLMHDLNGEIRFDSQAPTAVAGEWSAVACQGLTRGRWDGRFMDDGTIAYRHRLDAERISFNEISRLLTNHQEERRGHIQLTTVVEGRTGAPEAKQIKGYLYLEESHLADVPLLTELFQYVGIGQFDEFQSTDVEATFAVQDQVITLSQARVSNALSALDVEPGGLVDIESHHLDLYVIVAPVKQLHDLLAEIPLVNLLMDLKDRLIRVRVRGDWNASTASLLSKEPLRDIGEGTVNFFRDVISTGGRAGKSLYTGFMDLIE